MLGLGSSRFARRYSGSRCCFPFLGVLRCFSSPGSLLLPYFIQAGVTPHDGCRVSPFGHPRIEAWSTAPRGFSQSPTSFIGIRRQGIHRWHFIAWNFSSKRCSCSLSNSQGALRRMPGAAASRPEDATTPPAPCGYRRCDRTFKTEQRKDKDLPFALDETKVYESSARGRSE
jgi:hypothetical protein